MTFSVCSNLKQGVSEVLQYFDQSMGDLNSTDQGIQRLLGFLKASSQSFNNNNKYVVSKKIN